MPKKCRPENLEPKIIGQLNHGQNRVGKKKPKKDGEIN